MPTANQPIVLCMSGLDPTGGAGLAADIETIASLGGRAAPIATTITAQNTQDVLDTDAVATSLLIAQASIVMADLPISAIKIGLLGSAENARAISGLLESVNDLPVVLDPVLKAGGGREMANYELIDVIRDELLPKTTLLTPNLPEALRLAGLVEGTSAEAAHVLIEKGCANVLVTGGHGHGDGADGGSEEIRNILYRRSAEPLPLSWPKLEGQYHGSGCTLASAVAAGLASGLPLRDAIAVAENFTHEALRNATSPGIGQALPNRMYWALSRVRPL